MATGTLLRRTLPYDVETAHSYQLNLRALPLSVTEAVRMINRTAEDLKARPDPRSDRSVLLDSESLDDLTELGIMLRELITTISWGSQHQLRTPKDDGPVGPELLLGVTMWCRGERQFLVRGSGSYFFRDSGINLSRAADQLSADPGLWVAWAAGYHDMLIGIRDGDDRTPNQLARLVADVLEGRHIIAQSEDNEPVVSDTLRNSPDAYRANPRPNGWFALQEWSSGLLIKSRYDFTPEELSELLVVVERLTSVSKTVTSSAVHYDFVCVGYAPDLESGMVTMTKQALLQWFDSNGWEQL